MSWKHLVTIPLAVLAIAVVSLLLWADQALSPQAQALLVVAERIPRDSNLFNPLSGFAVSTDETPAEAGHAAVTRVNELLRSAKSSSAIGVALQQAWVRPALSIDDPDDALCEPKREGCIKALRDRSEALRQIVGRNRMLLARYGSLADFPEFRTELLPHVETPLPDLRVVMQTHRLWLASKLVSAFGMEATDRVAIVSDLAFTRRLLAQSDNLLTKMVATVMVLESLHVYAAMMDLEGARLEEFPVLDPLDETELSLTAALESEFRFSTSVLRSIEHDGVLQQDFGLPAWLGLAALRPLYKPNRSINVAFRCWQQEVVATRRRASAFLATRADHACELPWYEWVLNPIGTILMTIAGPDLSRYASRLHDLNGAITLVNLKREIRLTGVDEQTLTVFLEGAGAEFGDPYNGRPAHWRPESGTLEFVSPNPDLGFNVLYLSPLTK